MQPQCCEVHIEHDEYLREQQRPSSKQSAWLSWETTISSHSVQLKNMLTLSNSFNIIRTLCLLALFTLHCTWMTDHPKARAMPILTVIHTCWFNSHGDPHEAYTANTYMHLVYLVFFFILLCTHPHFVLLLLFFSYFSVWLAIFLGFANAFSHFRKYIICSAVAALAVSLL